MPSKEILLEKQAVVKELAEQLKGAKSVVLVDYKGINVADDTKLRRELREENVNYKVVKNSLLTFACKDAGFDGLIPELAGTTALALGQDETTSARILNKYSTQYKALFNMKKGFIDGKYVDAQELTAIAALPSRDGLIAMVAGSLNGIIGSLARAISEVAKKQEA